VKISTVNVSEKKSGIKPYTLDSRFIAADKYKETLVFGDTKGLGILKSSLRRIFDESDKIWMIPLFIIMFLIAEVMDVLGIEDMPVQLDIFELVLGGAILIVAAILEFFGIIWLLQAKIALAAGSLVVAFILYGYLYSIFGVQRTDGVKPLLPSIEEEKDGGIGDFKGQELGAVVRTESEDLEGMSEDPKDKAIENLEIKLSRDFERIKIDLRAANINGLIQQNHAKEQMTLYGVGPPNLQ
jgi:hypothetical protein